MAKNLLKETLVKEGVKQTDLAKESAISPATINRLCNEKRGVSPTFQSRIVNALNKLTTSGAKYLVKDIFPNSKLDT